MKAWQAGGAIIALLVGLLSWSGGMAHAAVSPKAPRNVQAAAGDSGGRIVVRWDAPSDSTGLVGYTVTVFDSLDREVVAARTTVISTFTGPVEISGLTNGEEYTGVVYARYVAGDVASEPSDSVIPYTTPSTPAKPTATRQSGGVVRVTWTAPSDGGSAITSYTVACTPTCTEVDTAQLFADVEDLTATTSYTFTVVATNARGDSAASPASDAVTPFGVPGAPQSVVATRGDASIAVSWAAPASNGGSAITGYTATASPGTASCTPATGERSCTITGLTNGTTYSVSVTAANAAGTGAAAQVANVTPATVPGKPTGVTASGGDSRATVAWTAPTADGGAAVTGYTVTSSPDSRTCTTSFLTCDVTGLTNGTSYTFTVTATNAIGAGAASDASSAITPSATTTVPGAPASITAAQGASPGSLSVTWTAPAVTGGSSVTAYAVGYATSLSGPWTTVSTSLPASGLSTTLSSLAQGTGYFVRVAASNVVGLGAWRTTTNSVLPRPGTSDPTASPDPGGSGGGGGGGGGGGEASPSPSPSGSPSPSASPSPSPSTSPSPTASPSPSPSPTSSPRPGPPGGLVPGDQGEASRVSVRGPAGLSPAQAPVVSVPRGSSIALVVRQLPRRTAITVQVKAGTRWSSLGRSRSNARGQAVLPAIDARRVGEYLLRLRSPGERPLYLKVLVTRSQ